MDTNITITFWDIFPYIASILCSIIAGITSYFVARKQAKADMAKIEKQHSLDIEKEREKAKIDLEKAQAEFQLEKERLELQHQYEMQMKDKELENNMSQNVINTLFSGIMDTPEIKKAISDGLKRD